MEEAFPEESVYVYFFWLLFPWPLDGNVDDYDEIAESEKWRSDQPYQRRFGRLVCRPSLFDLHNDWSSISSLIVKFCKEELQT